jgi:uncharacterized protein YdaU (DUF1376 family)
MKIRFVQLESDAFLTDMDFVQMSAAERGVYCSLILFLTSNDGRCRFDPAALGRLCNCERPEDFQQIWDRIAKKFQTRQGVIRHKRVTQELTRAKRLRQAKRKAGLNTAKKRWHSDSTANSRPDSEAIAKERKGNVIEKEREDTSNTNTTEHAPSVSSPVRARQTPSEQIAALHFNEALVNIIQPRTQSDRTCFHNVTNWLVEGCARGRFNEAIFARVLDYAKEARRGLRPAAVFMALLKKELRYKQE